MMIELKKWINILRDRRPVHLVVLLVLIVLVIWVSMVSKNIEVVSQDSSIIQISDDFSSLPINDIAVYRCDEDATEDFAPNDFDSVGQLKGFLFNKNPAELRPLKNQYRCWQYVSIYNSTDRTKELVLSVQQSRVDELAWYIYQHGEAVLQGVLKKEDPLYKRRFPYYNYAVPLTVSAGDTLQLLIRTKRVSGIYEIYATLYSDEVFRKNAQYEHTKKIILLSICAMIIAFVLIFGFYLKEPEMVSLGLYFLPVSFFIYGYYGFSSTWNFYPAQGLTIYNQFSFYVFLCNAAIHLFAYVLVKDYLKNKDIYKYAIGIIATINLFIALLFLFPNQDARLFHEGINVYFAVLTLFNLAWMIIFSCFVYLRSGQILYLVVWVVGTLPIIIKESSTQKYALSNIPYQYQGVADPIYLLMVLLLLFLFIIRSRIINKRRLEEEVKEQREKLLDQRKLEIADIGRTLHDHIGNSLAAILGYLQSNKPTKELLIPLTLKTISDLRVISHQLVDNELKNLSTAIDHLVQEFNNFSEINFHFLDQTDANINTISYTTQNNVFHMVQELLTNIIKHSQAKEAYVQIFEDETFFQVVVEDDGIGIPQHQNTKGIGLKNIEERAQLNQLDVFFDSTSQGTSVFIKIPKSAIIMNKQSTKK